MGIVFHVEPEVALESVAIAGVACQFLDLRGFEHQQLLHSIFNVLFLEELLKLLGESLNVLIFEFHPQVRDVVVEFGETPLERPWLMD